MQHLPTLCYAIVSFFFELKHKNRLDVGSIWKARSKRNFRVILQTMYSEKEAETHLRKKFGTDEQLLEDAKADLQRLSH